MRASVCGEAAAGRSVAPWSSTATCACRRCAGAAASGSSRRRSSATRSRAGSSCAAGWSGRSSRSSTRPGARADRPLLEAAIARVEAGESGRAGGREARPLRPLAARRPGGDRADPAGGRDVRVGRRRLRPRHRHRAAGDAGDAVDGGVAARPGRARTGTRRASARWRAACTARRATDRLPARTVGAAGRRPGKRGTHRRAVRAPRRGRADHEPVPLA